MIVERVLVGPGQPVAAGAPLDRAGQYAGHAANAYRQATDAAAFAQRDLARVSACSTSHLAANDQLDRGAARRWPTPRPPSPPSRPPAPAARRQTLIAPPFAGVVGAVPVALGDHVAGGAPLMTVVASGGMVAQLGVEPDPGRPAWRSASRSRSSRPSTATQRLREPAERSSAARSTPPPIWSTSPRRPGRRPRRWARPSRAEITVASHPGLTAPRAAVVFDEAGAHVFVVRGRQGPPSRRSTPGAEQGDDIEVTGST